MGLGMVFFGLEIMKDGFAIIKDLPAFERAFGLFDAKNHIGVFKCMLVGCVLTFIVQSSSATLGITIGLAQIGVIPFETAAALVLGENIGTTITAMLAAIGTTTNAKRAAAFHVVFNLIGVFVMWLLFFPYMDAVKFIVADAAGVIDPTRGIAATHTGFNVLNTLLFVGFIPWIARALERALPDKSRKETPHLTSLDIRLVETPVMAIEQSRGEILRMGDGCEKMMVWLKELTPQDPMDKKLAETLFHREEVLDSVQDEVVLFMTNLLAGHAPHKIIEEGRCQLRMADEYESISDYVASILRFHVRLNEQGHQIDERHRKELLELHDEVDAFLQFVTRGYRVRQPEPTTKVHTKADEIKYRIRRLRQEHIEFLSEEKSDPFKSVAYTAMLNSYQRVRDHALNIGEAVAGEK
jgi:phosphate:Na+ symporter